MEPVLWAETPARPARKAVGQRESADCAKGLRSREDALRLHDGGGIHSDADWFYPRAADSLKQLRRLWLQRIEQWGLEQRLVSAIASGARNPLLSDGEIQQLRFDVVSFLREQGIERSERVVPGQPLALELWDGLFTVTQDVDAELPRLLEHGVSTGVVNTIPPSGVWREVEVAERPDLELLVHDAPWGSGRIAALQNGCPEVWPRLVRSLGIIVPQAS